MRPVSTAPKGVEFIGVWREPNGRQRVDFIVWHEFPDEWALSRKAESVLPYRHEEGELIGWFCTTNELVLRSTEEDQSLKPHELVVL